MGEDYDPATVEANTAQFFVMARTFFSRDSLETGNQISNHPTIIGIIIRVYPEKCLQIAHCLAINSTLTTNMSNQDEVLQ